MNRRQFIFGATAGLLGATALPTLGFAQASNSKEVIIWGGNFAIPDSVEPMIKAFNSLGFSPRYEGLPGHSKGPNITGDILTDFSTCMLAEIAKSPGAHHVFWSASGKFLMMMMETYPKIVNQMGQIIFVESFDLPFEGRTELGKFVVDNMLFGIPLFDPGLTQTLSALGKRTDEAFKERLLTSYLQSVGLPNTDDFKAKLKSIDPRFRAQLAAKFGAGEIKPQPRIVQKLIETGRFSGYFGDNSHFLYPAAYETNGFTPIQMANVGHAIPSDFAASLKIGQDLLKSI